MSDLDTNTSIPVPPPSEQPSPASLDPTSEIVTERRNVALGQLAKDESVEAYAAERQDQAAAIDRGEELTQERQNQWYRRAHKALTDAANEAAGVQTNGQGEQEPQQPPRGYVPGDEAMREIENARKTGAAALRVQQYFGDNTERKQQIIDWHQSMDPESKVASWIIENESQFAPQIMERLADNPEALQQIASMPPHQRDRWLGMLEGHVAAQTNFAQQIAQQQQSWQQDRRMTKAPPIIRPPRGAASVPSDIHQLASRGESADDYVKARRAMEKSVTEFFGHVRGGFTTYVPGDGNSITECRRLLMFHGEDVAKVIEQFWREHSGDFVIVPETGYGVPPRPELCTERSLTTALQTAAIEPNSIQEKQWKAVCELHQVVWPRRLQPKAA